MNLSKSVAVFVLIYGLQWAIMGAMISFVSDYSFKEALTLMPVGTFMIIMGWIIPVIVAIDFAETATKKEKRAEIDREWARTLESWK
tara:strand:+ start:235 stop:495 length:261 start_codon:yes stop_codon:yes gene_type:complete